MCLSLPPLAERNAIPVAEEIASVHTKKHGRDVSCSGTYVFHALLRNGSVATISCIPIDGNVRFVMFPLAPMHVATLVPCGAAPCLTAHLEGCTRPFDKVPYTEEYRTTLVYRSLGSRDRDATEQAPIILPELAIVCNPDGGFIVVLKVASFIKEIVLEGERARLVTAMEECLRTGLTKHRIPLTRLFGAHYDEETAVWDLIHYLMTASVPGCDIVMGLLPEGSTRATFTLCSVCENDYSMLPFLGQCHGDQTPMGQVEEDVFLLTNHPSHDYVLPKAGEDDTFDVPVRLPRLEAYVKDFFRAPTQEDAHASYVTTNGAHVGVLYDSDDEYDWTVVHRGERGEHTHGNQLWSNTQRAYQAKLSEDLFRRVDTFLQEHELEPLALTTLRIANLKGYDLPRNTIQMHAKHDPVAYNTLEAMTFRLEKQAARSDKAKHSREA